MRTFSRKKCRYGPDCKDLHKWICNGKKGRLCTFAHSGDEISKAENEQDFSIGCWHCSTSKDFRRTSLCEVEHDPENNCELQNCNDGEKCWMFKFLQNSCGKEETLKLRQCIHHCLTYGHKVFPKRWCYIKIKSIITTDSLTKRIKPTQEFECSICHDVTDKKVCMLSCNHQFHSDCIRRWIGSSGKTCPNCRTELSPMDSSTEIKAILSRPDFDIMYTEEKKPVYGYSSPSYTLYDFDLKQWNAGLFHLLGHICNKCDYETFEMALSCRGCKLDAYTLMECIKKGDIRYLELIGKDKFAEHPTLRLPLHLNDPRFYEPKDVIVYETAKTIVNAESYNPLCRELLATWGLEFV